MLKEKERREREREVLLAYCRLCFPKFTFLVWFLLIWAHMLKFCTKQVKSSYKLVIWGTIHYYCITLTLVTVTKLCFKMKGECWRGIQCTLSVWRSSSLIEILKRCWFKACKVIYGKYTTYFDMFLINCPAKATLGIEYLLYIYMINADK